MAVARWTSPSGTRRRPWKPPVSHSGDAADDPAIWRNKIDPSRSTIIGNDKGGALEVYDLSGARIQRLTGGFYGS
jgi:3-phytase